jgi:hypothetical protein
MKRYTLTEVVPEAPEGISSRYYLVDPLQTDRYKILVVAFAGEYPEGSRGNRHGWYVATSTLHGLHAFQANCIILDFTELSYRWGNTLLQVFQDISQLMDAGGEPENFPFPVMVVTSEKCRDAFLSLVTPIGKPEPPWHFDDLNLAIEAGIRAANDWLS